MIVKESTNKSMEAIADALKDVIKWKVTIGLAQVMNKYMDEQTNTKNLIQYY